MVAFKTVFIHNLGITHWQVPQIAFYPDNIHDDLKLIDSKYHLINFHLMNQAFTNGFPLLAYTNVLFKTHNRTC